MSAGIRRPWTPTSNVRLPRPRRCGSRGQTSAVKQVAAELGFDDEAYFGRFFRKHTGYRPTDFRTQARAQLAVGEPRAAAPRDARTRRRAQR